MATPQSYASSISPFVPGKDFDKYVTYVKNQVKFFGGDDDDVNVVLIAKLRELPGFDNVWEQLSEEEITVAKLKTAILKRYPEQFDAVATELAWKNLQQSGSIAEFNTQFNTLAAKKKLSFTDLQFKYIASVRRELRDYLLLASMTSEWETIDEIQQLALIWETQHSFDKMSLQSKGHHRFGNKLWKPTHQRSNHGPNSYNDSPDHYRQHYQPKQQNVQQSQQQQPPVNRQQQQPFSNTSQPNQGLRRSQRIQNQQQRQQQQRRTPQIQQVEVVTTSTMSEPQVNTVSVANPHTLVSVTTTKMSPLIQTELLEPDHNSNDRFPPFTIALTLNDTTTILAIVDSGANVSVISKVLVDKLKIQIIPAFPN